MRDLREVESKMVSLDAGAVVKRKCGWVPPDALKLSEAEKMLRE